MGCFIGCFRIKDSNPNLVTPPVPAVSGSKNALSSLFQCDDESLQNGEEDQKNSCTGELDFKDEANFLEKCGTLPKTPPVEIGKALDKWEGESCSLVDSPSSCITDGQNPRSNMQNIITPIGMPDSETHSVTSTVPHQGIAPSVQRKSKSVRFECESENSAFSSKGSSSECASHHSEQSGSAGNRSVTESSPSPTPLKLTDEMQTPGTVFSAYMSDMATGKITKLRSQYLHSIPVEDPFESKDENSDSDYKRETLEQDNVMSTPMVEPAVKRFSVGKDMKIEASLSDWLKPVSSKEGSNNEQFGCISREKVYWGKTPRDRPILGMVAAHWNEEETSHISPKWWDGNGIPNSTNKYKEDQKVSWHATPFEERLEKALSEETSTSQRKHLGQAPPFDFDEKEESDTAFSHLQSSDT
ncbi:hypothetical protein OROGR_000056 [Orobanche gracilis]